MLLVCASVRVCGLVRVSACVYGNNRRGAVPGEPNEGGRPRPIYDGTAFQDNQLRPSTAGLGVLRIRHATDVLSKRSRLLPGGKKATRGGGGLGSERRLCVRRWGPPAVGCLLLRGHSARARREIISRRHTSRGEAASKRPSREKWGWRSDRAGWLGCAWQGARPTHDVLSDHLSSHHGGYS